MFLYYCFENTIKDHIILNEHSVTELLFTTLKEHCQDSGRWPKF